MKCPICELEEIQIVYANYPGYVDGTDFDIFECIRCNTQFVSVETVDPEIYNIAYSNKSTPGYYRYLTYAKEIKNKDNPLKFLSEAESVYYPIYIYLKDKTHLDILEVGCGYGYLTYSLRSLGHNAEGIDISSRAIHYASSHYGDYYQVAKLEDYHTHKKYDLIIATELIEHLINPVAFISLCVDLLKANGAIILTTRNKDYYSKKSVWGTDLPPVHTTWLSKTSFKYIAEMKQMNCMFVDYTNYVGRNENKLMSYLYMKWTLNRMPKSILSNKGDTNRKNIEMYIRIILKYIVFFAPVRYTCSYINQLFTKDHDTLGVIMKRKNLKSIFPII